MKETRFKDTEIGRIPEDWEVKPISKIYTFKQGVQCGVEKQKTTKENGFIRFIRIIDLTQANEPPRYVEDPGIPHHIFKEDLFMVRYGSPGIIGIGYEGVIANNLFRLIPIRDVVPKFMKYNFNYVYTQIAELASSSTMPAINFTSLSNFQLIVPKDKEEQSRIASALTSIDNLISSLDKLIEKKKNIKQGTMQQLLTGKKRLKGFTEPWAEKQLGKIGSTFSGLTGKTKEDFGTGNAKYITFLNVLNNPILKSELFEDVVVREGEKQNSCHKGDLFFNTSSETPEEVGICAMLNTEQNSLYLNSFCFGYRLNDENIVPEYLAYYFRSNEGRKLMTVLAQGVTRYNMSKSAFNNAKIMMPTTSMEQQAIAEVLKSMDKEIEAIEIKKAKYDSLKEGMMQQLLTGKIRLI